MNYLKVPTDFAEVIEPFDDAEIGRIFRAMLDYAKSGAEPDFCGNERFLWPAAKQIIDHAAGVSEKRKESGAIGGKQKVANDSKSKQTVANDSKIKQNIANGFANESEREKERSKEKEKEKANTSKETLTNVSAKKGPNKSGTAKRGFVPPTLEEIAEYCKSRNSSVSPQQFFDFFNTPNSSGETWIDSKGQPVLNWKQKLLTWERFHLGEVKPDVRRDPEPSACGYNIDYD